MSERPDGWTYRTFQWRAGDELEFEAWVQSIADDGWSLWMGPGAWSTIGGQRTFGLPVRRRVERPWATPPR